MKFIHTSDRHYGQPGAMQSNQWVNAAIQSRADIAQCVVIDTGDIVETPDPWIYRLAEIELAPLARACHAFLATPGNHDLAYAGLSRSGEAPAFWAKFTKTLASNDPAYPIMKTFGNVAVILIDSNIPPESAWKAATSDFVATGYIGKGQLDKVASMVRKARQKSLRTIVALHHSPAGGDPTLRLEDWKALGAALEGAGGVDLMLAGHLHQAGEWSHVFGARVLLSSPKTPRAQGYREIWWCDVRGRFDWKWVDV